MGSGNAEPYQHKRDNDPADCYARHGRWMDKWWEKHGMPKVRLLVLLTVGGMFSAMIVVSFFIADVTVERKAITKPEYNRHKDKLEAVLSNLDEKMDMVHGEIQDISIEVAKVQTTLKLNGNGAPH